jgi:hypothetical protein
MPRPLSGPLVTALAQVITGVGYLVQWNMAGNPRWSDIGDLTWNSVVWAATDFTVSGLTWDVDIDQSCTIKVSNVGNAAGALFLGQNMADVTVDLYQYERSATASGDIAKLVQLAVDSVEIALDAVTIRLIAQSSMNAMSPRLPIDPANGFKFGMAAGKVIPWGNEVFNIQSEDANG